MKVLVTGGLGFIGSNFIMSKRCRCICVDNAVRKSINDYNLKRLLGSDIDCHFLWEDVNYIGSEELLIKDVTAVVHLAAQVAVTTSIEEPMNDFVSNARGTLAVLEAVRKHSPKAQIIYASTNKVYGDRPDGSFSPSTPYGVSKATGDLYCQEYAKTYGIKTAVLRQSCIYGPHQDYTSVDQGWVCHIAGNILSGKTVQVFGDGEQTRDLLYVDDLVELYNLILDKGITGVYDVGGGDKFEISVNEAIKMIEDLTGKKAVIEYKPWRLHDQKRYVADIDKICSYGWKPKTKPEDGIKKMVDNIMERINA